MVGVVPIQEAQRRAAIEPDLVLISPSPDNPVCKIMDYGKFMFEQEKKETGSAQKSENRERQRSAAQTHH